MRPIFSYLNAFIVWDDDKLFLMRGIIVKENPSKQTNIFLFSFKLTFNLKNWNSQLILFPFAYDDNPFFLTKSFLFRMPNNSDKPFFLRETNKQANHTHTQTHTQTKFKKAKYWKSLQVFWNNQELPLNSMLSISKYSQVNI